MWLFRTPTARQLDIGLATARAVVGLIFLVHGGQKLFVFGFEGVSGAFAEMGIPMAGMMGPFVALLEFFGGLALIVGLLTRLAALGLAFNMLGAILLVHLQAGFFLPQGYEFALALLGTSVLFVLSGAGAYSVDTLVARRTDADAVADADETAQSAAGARRTA